MITLDHPDREVVTSPVLLTAYVVTRCPVVTQNEHDPALSDPPPVADRVARRRAERAAAKDALLDELADHVRGRVLDLRTSRHGPFDAEVEACRQAVASAADVVVGGQLPVDLAGHRRGSPDLLVRAAGVAAYHPVIVTQHRILRPVPEDGAATDLAGAPVVPATVSTLGAPWRSAARALAGLRLRVTSRSPDLLQLAHHYRVMQACGIAAERPRGAIVGTDRAPTDGSRVLAWVDLDEPLIRVADPASAQGWRLASALEVYDREHQFRLAVAEAAEAGADPPPLRPAVIRECAECVWWASCRDRLPADDLSLGLARTPLDRREIESLRSHGISTIDELAASDVEDLLGWYLPEVAQLATAETRIRTAARRCRMLVSGAALDRESTGSIQLPAAAVEIDLDIETSAAGRSYLWGFLVSRADSAPQYRGFSRFADLDDSDEVALAAEAFSWLRGLVETGPPAAVYHYSGYEPAIICALAERSKDPMLGWAAAYAQESFVDLLPIVKTHYFGAQGLGLKLVAAEAGFTWRDDEPGGLNSQLWFDDAVHHPDPQTRDQARIRVLEYNEDDVRATHRLRQWLRSQ